MNKIGFDNKKYLSLQSEKIQERIDAFGDKLYLEFGGNSPHISQRFFALIFLVTAILTGVR